MSRTHTPTPSFTNALAPEPTRQLPLGLAHVVRVSLEGSDFGAVEAAAAELKVRFGARFAITGRRLTAARSTLRISACMMANLNTVLDAEGFRQWIIPARWDTHVVEDQAAMTAERGDDERGTGGADGDAPIVPTSISQT